MARPPSTRISMLSTSERTGRWTKISVNFIAPLFAQAFACSSSVRGGPSPAHPCVVYDPPSLLLWTGSPIVGRLRGVTDDQRCSVEQLQLAAGHDQVALLDSLQYGNLVTARRPESHEALLCNQVLVRAAVLAGGEKYRRAIRIVGNRGLRQCQVVLDVSRLDGDPGKHSRHEAPLSIGDGGLRLKVAGARVYARIDRRDLACELDARERVGGQVHHLAIADLCKLLLWELEVDIDGVQGLQRDDLVTRIEILARVDCRDAQPAGKRRAQGLLGYERRLCCR